MMAYKPNFPFSTPLMLLIPETVTTKGVQKKIYPEKGKLFFCSFRTFGGTETESNSVYIVENTAVIETWYRPDIRANCAVKTTDGSIYEILGEPEDIDKRHQFLKFKVRAVKGGA